MNQFFERWPLVAIGCWYVVLGATAYGLWFAGSHFPMVTAIIAGIAILLSIALSRKARSFAGGLVLLAAVVGFIALVLKSLPNVEPWAP